MDHVSATNGLSKTERENISGARVFDGEDQGKFHHNNYLQAHSSICYRWERLIAHYICKPVKNNES